MDRWERSAIKNKKKFLRLCCHGNYSTCEECPDAAKSKYWKQR